MNIALSVAGQAIIGRHVQIRENQPLAITITTSRNFSIRPDVVMDGAPMGEPLVRLVGEEIEWCWTYISESWCGRTVLTVVGDEAPVELRIETKPSSSKFSDDDYDRMINHILRYDAQVVWGMTPGLSGGEEADGERLGVTHPALVAHYLDPLLEQLTRILTDPVLAHRREDLIKRFDFARPITARTVSWFATRAGHLARLTLGSTDLRVPQYVRRDSFHHPANRYVRTLALRLRAALDATSRGLMLYAKAKDDVEKQRATFLAERAHLAAQRLSYSLERSFLQTLESGEMTESVAQVFADHPAYARFSKLANRLLGAGLRVTNNRGLDSSLRRTWDIFEIYSVYRMVEALELHLGQDWVFTHEPPQGHILSGPREGICWSAKKTGHEWQLHYQQSFGHSKSAPYSVTVSRRPDLCLVHLHDGKLLHWFLFDAKYRSAPSSINEALASMHVYRDSLLWRCPSTNTLSPASGGYLVVPTVSEGCARYADRHFIDAWGIGLIAIDDHCAMSRLLDTVLTHGPEQ